MPESSNQDIQLKVQEHDLRLNAIDRIMTESVAEQKQLVRELHELTSSFKVYIERHDQVNENSRRMWAIVERQQEEIDKLQEFVAASNPIIEGVRTLQNKITLQIASTILSPAAIVGAIIYLGGGA